MSVRWSSAEGSPYPLGAIWIDEEQAFNFSIYSSSAWRARLLLFSAEDWLNPAFTYEFDIRRNKTGPVWHARVGWDLLPGARYYAYSIDGPSRAFRPHRLLLDPYAKAIFFPPTFDRAAAYGEESNAGKAPLGILPLPEPPFDWGEDRPPRHDNDLILYELQVRGFTMNPNSGIAAPKRGTFQGIVEKIPHLKELGITAVELMPVFEFDQTEPNYWGYMPLNFFAPHHEFSSDSSPGRQVVEFKSMVKALHAADIEVILDVVYNHTGEGDELGPIFSFKGIDCWSYYISSGDPRHPYADFSGTGNTFNCANRAVRQLIVDSLRYWVHEMHVDGFRFDLASVFSRKPAGSIDFSDPPIFGDIAEHPDLEKVRLIAEPWEGNPKYPNYELGEGRTKPHFPGNGWRQWNDVFRTTVRHFIKSDPGTLGDFVTRLYGSADLFPDSLEESCRPYQSVNYVDSHDGLTLYDLVSYTTLESWNCGERDGDAGIDTEVMRLRKRQVKNFCCALMLSNGTPMFRAGDEFLRTQYGNENPYNVDGPLTWIDWSRLDAHRNIFRFFSKMVGFRKAHPSIGRSTFWREDVRWYGVEAGIDFSRDSHAFAFCLHGASQGDKNIYAMINTYWEPLQFNIQEWSNWTRIVDTFAQPPDDFIDERDAPIFVKRSYGVGPRSIAVFVSA
ncbi:MAG TPA: isoamylase [Bryobacteraceae bacterium]